jgi:hypothetical protein
MSDHAGALFYMGSLATVNIAVAASMLLRPRATAAANKAFIESGKETYFEQRRAWKAYGTTPETDPERLKRKAWRLLYFNLGMIGFAALIDALR